VQDAQVEQDLVISRALVGMFSVPQLARRLAFRGGTALFKLHLRPAARYSEDIDLVQVTAGPIGDTLDALRDVLDPWLGVPRRATKEGRVNLVYRFQSEDEPANPMRLKIEINSREHFSEHDHMRHPFEVRSRWWAGRAEITTFTLEELLGTKMRALYQRKKGRDLFDLWWALQHGADPGRITTCFARYMRESGHRVSRAQFERNLEAKIKDDLFSADMAPLLRIGAEWDPDTAAAIVSRELLARLPGEAAKRPSGGTSPT
jgi:predicted nucleotidyltransferase component of viral defense system